MTLALSKRCAIVACVASAALLPGVALAQQTTQNKTDTKKTDKDKTDAEKKASEDQKKNEAQGTSSAAVTKPEEKPKESPLDEEAKRAVFISGDIAFTRVDLGGISNNLSFDRTAANGLLYGFAGGLRFHDLRVGARWRVQETTEFNMWSVAGTLGYGLPLRPLEPIFSVNVGYVWDQKIERGAFSSSMPPGTVLPPDVSLKGLLLGLDINAAYWVTKFIRLGAFIGSDFMFLKRAQSALPSSIFPISDEFKAKPLYADTGSSIAYTINIGLRGAFDIGF